MSGRLTIREATEAARSLGTFTRREFADAIGVSPLEAGKWLKRLGDERKLIVRDSAKYRWDPADERPDPEAAPHEGEDPRIAARKLLKRHGQFTAGALGEAMGTSAKRTAENVKFLLDVGVIRDSGKTEWRERGKRPTIYEEVAIESNGNGSRPKREPVEVELRRKGLLPEPPERPQHHRSKDSSHMTAPKKPVVRHPELKRIIDAIYEQGGEVRHAAKHFKAILPNGDTFTLPTTPRAARIPKTISMVRRHGILID
jgi:hypothetical protein